MAKYHDPKAKMDMIVLAVANGATKFDEISQLSGLAIGTIGNYFYDHLPDMPKFANGDILSWTPGAAGSIRLAHNIAVVRNADGEAIEVMRVDADFVENTEASARPEMRRGAG